jgi:hypothetical protein
MQRFRQPPRTIPGATITADRITFPLDDPNDPRLKAYKDSLSLQRPTIRFQNGGVVLSPREAYENNNVYAYRPNEDMFYSNLSGVDVVAKDTRVADAVRGGQNRFLRGAADLMGQPQQQMMGAITGTRQAPSQAWGFKDPQKFGQKAANFVIDLVADPINALPGIGLYNLTRKAGVNSGRVLFRPLRTAGENALSLAKAKGYNPAFRKIMDEEIANAISPENFKRAAALDKEHGTVLTRSLGELRDASARPRREFDYPLDVVKESMDEGVAAYTGLTPDGHYMAHKLNTIQDFSPKLFPVYQKPSFKDTFIRYNPKLFKGSEREMRRTFQHELRHQIEAGGTGFPRRLEAEFSGLMQEAAPFMKTFKNANPNISMKKMGESDFGKTFNYFRTPTEISAYSKNLRQDLLDKGIIKSIDEPITEETMQLFFSRFNSAVNNRPDIKPKAYKDFNFHVDQSKGKEWANFFNKYLLSATGGAVTTSKLKQQQTQ